MKTLSDDIFLCRWRLEAVHLDAKDIKLWFATRRVTWSEYRVENSHIHGGATQPGIVKDGRYSSRGQCNGRNDDNDDVVVDLEKDALKMNIGSKEEDVKEWEKKEEVEVAVNYRR